MPSNKFLTDKENPLVPSERAKEAAIRSQRTALQYRLMHGEVLESIAQTIEDGLHSEDISVRLSTVDRWHKLTESAAKAVMTSVVNGQTTTKSSVSTAST